MSKVPQSVCGDRVCSTMSEQAYEGESDVEPLDIDLSPNMTQQQTQDDDDLRTYKISYPDSGMTYEGQLQGRKWHGIFVLHLHIYATKDRGSC